MSTVAYNITIKNVVGETACNGYYIYTGLTTNFSGASFINGVQVLRTISPVYGYSFYIELDSSVKKIYTFLSRCDDGPGEYQINLVDLRSDYCFKV